MQNNRAKMHVKRWYPSETPVPVHGLKTWTAPAAVRACTRSDSFASFSDAVDDEAAGSVFASRCKGEASALV